MTDDRFDPNIEARLRAVAPADAATREAHIAAAMSVATEARPTGLVGSSSRWRSSMLIAAAAAVVLAFVVGRLSVDSDPAPIVDAATTTIVKAGVDTCRESLDADAELLHTYEVADVDYAIVGVNGQIFIMETRTCSFITQFSIEAPQPPTSG